MQSIEVGFRVIRVLADANQPLPLKDIAAGAAMPASKAYVYLISFVREGLVQQDQETGHYSLGRLAVTLGLAAVRQADLPRNARPELESLRTAIGCSAYLSIWANRGPVVVVKADGPWLGSLGVRIGYVLPLRRTATGRIFLAYQPETEWKDLVSAEEAAEPASLLNDQRRVRAEAKVVLPLDADRAAIRAAGFATSPHWTIHGVSALAAPILDHGGAIAATVTILGPDDLVAGHSSAPVLDMLRAVTQRLSRSLGHDPAQSRNGNQTDQSLGQPASPPKASSRAKGQGRLPR